MKNLKVDRWAVSLMVYMRSDIPQRRRHDPEKVIDCRESGLEIMIIETTMNNKEHWVYVVGYKPTDVDSVFIDVFSLLCDLMLKESNNDIILGYNNCDFMSDNVLKYLCISYGMHKPVSAPTCHRSSMGTSVSISVSPV